MYRVMTAQGNRTATSLLEIQRLYNRGEIAIGDVLRRDTEKGWRVVGDALGESLLGSGSRARTRRAPIPLPPPISWSFVLLIGCVTGGWGLGVAGVMQGIWSRRIEPRLLPVLWPLCGLLLPPAHLVWAVSLMIRDRPEIIPALIHIAIGLLAAELVGVSLTFAGALSVRKTLLKRFGAQGFRMSALLTLMLGPVFVAYKAEELKRLHE